jgi:hypothetical protein
MYQHLSLDTGRQAAPCRVLIVSPAASQSRDSRVNVLIALCQRDRRFLPLSTSINLSVGGVR